MEQAKGIGGNNIVTVLMQEKQVGLQAAVDLVGEHFSTLMARFQEDVKRIPTWGPRVDASVAAYVAAMEHWVVGNLVWSFETQRYFGPGHAEVKRTRVVRLRPVDSDAEDEEQ